MSHGTSHANDFLESEQREAQKKSESIYRLMRRMTDPEKRIQLFTDLTLKEELLVDFRNTNGIVVPHFLPQYTLFGNGTPGESSARNVFMVDLRNI